MLLDLYARLAGRHMAPQLQLAGFQRRWIAWRHEDLLQGVERAVLDCSPEVPLHEVEDTLLAQARSLAGANTALVTAEISLQRYRSEEGDELDEGKGLVLTIKLEETGQPTGVLGWIELDAQHRPVRACRPLPLMLPGAN
ncbi:hypothetical protein [Azohydromonas lata]|uniref:Uncharacterized protein n=1 Tax=Azohydromonas lata TaxID=45677 RepID=A0ABU5I9N0_9BURK|nr:hypothetical protein [Azohydromonas lata]MDZ5455809.1 hypothetical protein [Azohydromonas lata]